jgi:hypothetical protein
MPVYSVEMEGGESLHLKSLMSHLNASTLVIGDTQEGHQLWSIICQLVGQNAYQPIFIADSITANVLALPRDKFMLVQSGRDQQGVDRLQQWASDNQWKFATVHMSETIKADAALTCQSVLVGHQ